MPDGLRIALHMDGRRVRGNERQLLHLAEGLIARGHELHVSCVAGSPAAEAFRRAGARTTGARPRGDLDPVSLFAYVRWLRRVRPHVALLSSWKRAATSALGARLAHVPLVALRVGGPHPWTGNVGDRLRRHALRQWVDLIWANSEELGGQLLQYAEGAPRAGLHVVPNAVVLEQVSPFPLRALLPLAERDRIVFTAAGLERNKGHDVLLAALARLSPDVHLVVAGGGPLRQELERRAESLGVGGRVHLLGHRTDVPALLGAADAFALATRADSTPNAALEAMAAGLPVVIAAVPGSAALLDPAGSEPRGWVVPVDDAEGMAAALQQALGAAGRERGARAQAWVLREHTPAGLTERVESMLRAAAAGPREVRTGRSG